MLVLPIKKEWFDMIAVGEKKEEYRDIKPYYASRFFKNHISAGIGLETILKGKCYDDRDVEIYTYVILRNGYRADSPELKCYVHIKQGFGKEEWGAEKGKKYYILEILEIIEIKNWDPMNTKEAMGVAALPATNPINSVDNIQKEITNAINKQFSIGIDIGEGISKSAQAIKNTILYGGRT